MTSFGKTLSAILIIIIAALIVWFVSRKPAPVTPAPETPAPVTSETTPSQSSTVTNSSSFSDDTTAIDTEMSGLDADAAAAAVVQ
jgi:cytoskeletal protein RodZ